MNQFIFNVINPHSHMYTIDKQQIHICLLYVVAIVDCCCLRLISHSNCALERRKIVPYGNKRYCVSMVKCSTEKTVQNGMQRKFLYFLTYICSIPK